MCLATPRLSRTVGEGIPEALRASCEAPLLMLQRREEVQRSMEAQMWREQVQRQQEEEGEKIEDEGAEEGQEDEPTGRGGGRASWERAAGLRRSATSPRGGGIAGGSARFSPYGARGEAARRRGLRRFWTLRRGGAQ